MYKVVGWHKSTPNLKSPPLQIGDTVIEDTLEKAETLRREVLDRFSSVDDLQQDPL